MSQRMVFPLFSAPVYVNNVGAFERPDLRSLEYSSTLGELSYNFLSSVDKNVLDRPEWKSVHALVTQEINAYARDVLAVSKSIELYVTNSWINIHRRGQSAGPHVHHNSLISGVLYLNVTETTGDLVFHRNDLSLVP